MGVDLTAEEIIKIIKRKEEDYKYENGSDGCLYFDNKKFSPVKILNPLGYTRSSQETKITKNLYAKLLSILPQLNTASIYLKTPNKYLEILDKFGITREQYDIQLQNILEKEQLKVKKETSMKPQPLNQILYGPPGTGKTYNTINKALEIIDGKVPKNRKEAKERYDELRELGQIEFITFHQSYGYEEFVEGIKADLDSDDIRYVLEEGMFKRLSNIAEKNYLNSTNSTRSKKDFDLIFKELIVDKFEDEKLKITTTQSYFYITDINERTIYFEKASGNQAHTLSIRSLKKMYEKETNDFLKGGLSSYYQPLLDLLLSKAYEEVVNEEQKNYILIIDEINRGNISKIFGELITLIEPSKRIGEEEEIKLTLPNSKEAFGVPSNLYIIGTMNTADRSIAQIDTALRRRFEFVEMMPRADLLEDVIVDGIEIQTLIEAINERIEYIYDREHTIGHSYFMPLIETLTKDKLDEIFRVNIIPLLAEYFYGDWADIIEVLNDNGFIEEKKLKYTTKSNRGNKVYEINSKFTVEAYQKIYNTQND